MTYVSEGKGKLTLSPPLTHRLVMGACRRAAPNYISGNGHRKRSEAKDLKKKN